MYIDVLWSWSFSYESRRQSTYRTSSMLSTHNRFSLRISSIEKVASILKALLQLSIELNEASQVIWKIDVNIQHFAFFSHYCHKFRSWFIKNLRRTHDDYKQVFSSNIVYTKQNYVHRCRLNSFITERVSNRRLKYIEKNHIE